MPNDEIKIAESENSIPLIPMRKPGLKLIHKVIIGMILLLALGIGISLATRIWDPLWNPFRPSPEKVIAEMGGEMEKIKTSESEVNFEMKLKNQSEFKMTGNILIDSDTTDKENIKSKSKLDLGIAVDGITFSLAGDSITLGDIFYFRLTTFPDIPSLMGQQSTNPEEANFFSLFQNFISGIKNQWIKIDPESIKDLLKNFLLGTTGGSLPPEFEEMLEKTVESQKQFQERIEKMIAGKKILLVKKELPDEKIGETEVYHYLIVLNKSEVKKLIPEFIDMYFDLALETVPDQFKPSEDEIEREKQRAIDDLEESFDEFFGKIGDIEAELWIGQKDLLLYKFSMVKAIDMAKLSENGEKGTLNFKMNMSNSKFGQSLEIKAPDQSKSINEIFEETLGLIMQQYQSNIEEYQSSSRDGERKSDMTLINTAMQLYYDNYQSYPSLQIFPTKIGDINVPQEPGFGPCTSYGWISNLTNSQKFCAWACLESGKFYAVSHKGTRELNRQSTSLDCW